MTDFYVYDTNDISLMDPLQQETQQTWDKLADMYWDKFSAFRIYDETYDYFLKSLPEGQPSVLDLGCGPGIISAYVRAKRQNIRITAVDVSPNMVKPGIRIRNLLRKNLT